MLFAGSGNLKAACGTGAQGTRKGVETPRSGHSGSQQFYRKVLRDDSLKLHIPSFI